MENLFASESNDNNNNNKLQKQSQQQRQNIDQPHVKTANNKNSKLPSLYKISLSDPSSSTRPSTGGTSKDTSYILRGGFKIPSTPLASSASLVEIQKANTFKLESFGPLLSRSGSLPGVNHKNNPTNNNSNIY
jgi:hypothetical protein